MTIPKNVKRTLIALLVLSFSVLLYYANAFYGNPLSTHLATRAAQKHLETVYADTDYTLDRVGYHNKRGAYIADISSPSSVDTHFQLEYNGTGKLVSDSYEYSVTSGMNTFIRLMAAYSALFDTVRHDAALPPYFKEGSADIMQRHFDDEFSLLHGRSPSEFALDGSYDIKLLGADSGLVYFYLEEASISYDRLAQLLVEARAQLKSVDFPFVAITFHLREPWDNQELPPKSLSARRILAIDMDRADLALHLEQAAAQYDADQAALAKQFEAYSK